MGKQEDLKCNSALVYDADGEVFIELINPQHCGQFWIRMPLEQAEKEHQIIIKCSQCDNPATSLLLYQLAPKHSPPA